MKVAFASGKGGTGKTTVAVNLAHYASEKMPVILADLDVEAPDTSQFLDLGIYDVEQTYKNIPAWNPDSCTNCKKCAEVCQFGAIAAVIDEITIFPRLCHSCEACSVLCESRSLEMVPQPLGEIRACRNEAILHIEGITLVGEEQTASQIRKTIAFADTHADAFFASDNIPLMIFDAPPGTACPAIAAMHAVDMVILVTEPTPFGLHDLRLAVKSSRELGKEPLVIINRHGIGTDEVERYCAKEKLEIIARFPFRRRTAEHYASGELIYPDSDEWKTGLQLILETLLNKAGNHQSGGMR